MILADSHSCANPNSHEALKVILCPVLLTELTEQFLNKVACHQQKAYGVHRVGLDLFARRKGAHFLTHKHKSFVWQIPSKLLTLKDLNPGSSMLLKILLLIVQSKTKCLNSENYWDRFKQCFFIFILVVPLVLASLQL